MATLTLSMPPTPLGHLEKGNVSTSQQLPQSLIDRARVSQKADFDPSKHINFAYPKKIHTMKELGLEGQGISTTAISEPFPLFTEEAVRQMRAEIFSQKVLDSCQVDSSFATKMIRGHCPEKAPFIYDAWYSQKVLDVVSRIAGVDLVPAMDLDVGHCNVSIDPHIADISSEQLHSLTKENEAPGEAFAWHTDSYPFVCVTMLSDCTGMIGGETAIRTGHGEVWKTRGPSMGTAVIMQGRYIPHRGLKALGGRERISMVTSFRPRDPLALDTTVLTNVRGISDVSTLYFQYAEYRLQNLEERVRAQIRTLRSRKNAKRKFDTAQARRWLVEQREYLDAMLEELKEEDADG